MNFKSVIAEADHVGTALGNNFDEGWLPLTFIGLKDDRVLLVFQRTLKGAEDLEELFGSD